MNHTRLIKIERQVFYTEELNVIVSIFNNRIFRIEFVLGADYI